VFVIEVTDTEIARERAIAKRLRHSQWWRQKLSKGLCYYCNRSVPQKELTMDHLVPIIRGGKSVKNNLVPACKECNNKKKYLLPLEWDEYLHRLSIEDP
jgi:5-methylcytosine-specific restriction endonuclease McrA